MPWLMLLVSLAFGEDTEGSGAAEEDFKYAWEEGGPDYADLTRRGLAGGSAGLVTGGVGVGFIGAGLALREISGACAPVDGVCTAPWPGEGALIGGVVIAHIGAITLASGSLKARKGLRGQGQRLSVAAGAAAIPMWLVAAGTTPLWAGVASPEGIEMKVPYVKSGLGLGLSGSFLVAAYGLGLTQHLVNHKGAKRVTPSAPAEDASGWLLVPSVGGRGEARTASLHAVAIF